MKATFLDEKGGQQPFEMGCYGIGVTRIVAGRDRAEQRRARHRLSGPIAPFTVSLVPIGYASRRRCAPQRTSSTRSSGGEGSMSCSTIATSAPAYSSPIWT
jgi:prolyl-tRNA synthetase